MAITWSMLIGCKEDKNKPIDSLYYKAVVDDSELKLEGQDYFLSSNNYPVDDARKTKIVSTDVTNLEFSKPSSDRGAHTVSINEKEIYTGMDSNLELSLDNGLNIIEIKTEAVQPFRLFVYKEDSKQEETEDNDLATNTGQTIDKTDERSSTPSPEDIKDRDAPDNGVGSYTNKDDLPETTATSPSVSQPEKNVEERTTNRSESSKTASIPTEPKEEATNPPKKKLPINYEHRNNPKYEKVLVGGEVAYLPKKEEVEISQTPKKVEVPTRLKTYGKITGKVASCDPSKLDTRNGPFIFSITPKRFIDLKNITIIGGSEWTAEIIIKDDKGSIIQKNNDEKVVSNNCEISLDGNGGFLYPDKTYDILIRSAGNVATLHNLKSCNGHVTSNDDLQISGDGAQFIQKLTYKY